MRPRIKRFEIDNGPERFIFSVLKANSDEFEVLHVIRQVFRQNAAGDDLDALPMESEEFLESIPPKIESMLAREVLRGEL